MTTHPITKSFIHCADLHLGFNQFNLETRFNDFDRAFGDIVQTAIDRSVNYMLISGDIFNKRNINAATLDVAIRHFQALKTAGIQVIAIEGNHDQAHYYDQFSWMYYLYKSQHLCLLKPVYEQGQLKIDAVGLDTAGILYEDEFIRIFGIGYHGNLLSDRIKALSEQIAPDPRFTVLMAHGGVGGIEIGRLSLEDLRPLYQVFDYIALGHQHSTHVYDDRVYIPGSPEYYDLGEAGKSKGFFHICFSGKSARTTFIESVKRSLLDYNYMVTGEDWAVQEDLICAHLSGQARDMQEPLVRLELEGAINIDLTAQLREQLRDRITVLLGALYVEIVDNTGSEQLAIRYDAFDNSITAIERAIITQELAKDPQYFEQAAAMTDFILHFMQMELDHPSLCFDELKVLDAHALLEKTPQAHENTVSDSLESAVLLSDDFIQTSLFSL